MKKKENKTSNQLLALMIVLLLSNCALGYMIVNTADHLVVAAQNINILTSKVIKLEESVHDLGLIAESQEIQLARIQQAKDRQKLKTMEQNLDALGHALDTTPLK